MYVAFQSGGVDLTKPVVLTCGGAMVAPLVTFALSLSGSTAPVYDVRTINIISRQFFGGI